MSTSGQESAIFQERLLQNLKKSFGKVWTSSHERRHHREALKNRERSSLSSSEIRRIIVDV